MRYILAFMIILMPACASDRYLTADEDAELRAKCEPATCAVIPMPLWIQIEQFIRSMSGTAI
jgi:hypothetical protein